MQARLYDANDNMVACLQVESEDCGLFTGVITHEWLPCEMADIFNEYQSIVEGVVLSLLDNIESRIDDLKITVEFPMKKRYPVNDLQMFGLGTGQVKCSFRVDCLKNGTKM